jgi:hypothetical protein
MSEMPRWVADRAASEAGDQPRPVESESTGDEAVDAVVSSVRGLDDLPVTEHVAVFERAHESLRQVLTGAGEPTHTARASQG